jgi:hypothetical protein
MKIYRILSVASLFEMFKNKTNLISSPENWEDQWEKLALKVGDPKKRDLFFKYRKMIYAQSWSEQYYSWAMWKLYSKNGFGARITVTKNNLFESLPKEVRDDYAPDGLLRETDYLTEKEYPERIKEIFDSTPFNLGSLRQLYFIKRRAFEFEKEVRLIVPKRDKYKKLAEVHVKSLKFISYKIDPCDLVEDILFDSSLNDSLLEIYQIALKKMGYKKRAEKSTIDKTPDALKV